MAIALVDAIYEQVKDLPVAQRLQLVERIAHDLATQNGTSENKAVKRYDWMSVRSIAPNLLGGEDAQDWVSRTRREADEHREAQWRHET